MRRHETMRASSVISVSTWDYLPQLRMHSRMGRARIYSHFLWNDMKYSKPNAFTHFENWLCTGRTVGARFNLSLKSFVRSCHAYECVMVSRRLKSLSYLICNAFAHLKPAWDITCLDTLIYIQPDSVVVVVNGASSLWQCSVRACETR